MGKRYYVWVLYVEFVKGNETVGRLAVALPVAGGKITILDPAGKYYTSTFFGSITVRDVVTELQNYFSYWISSEYRNSKVYAIYSYNMYKIFNNDFIHYVKSIT